MSVGQFYIVKLKILAKGMHVCWSVLHGVKTYAEADQCVGCSVLHCKV